MGAEQPLYRHECATCVFLGIHEAHDLYHCEQAHGPTVIARYGDEPHEYVSGYVFARRDFSEPLWVAKEQAVARGLILAEQAEDLIHGPGRDSEGDARAC